MHNAWQETILYFPAVNGEDFVSATSLPVPILASDLDVEVCENITTVADMIVEGSELFHVSVLSTDAPISTLTVDPDTQTLVILDNSSEFQ